MTNTFGRSMLGLFILGTFLAGEMYADTFEYLTFTPPPAGWTKPTSNDGAMYRRSNGIGLIAFYPSYVSSGSASDEFAKIWSARVGPTIPGPAPQPVIQRDGDYNVAVGSKQVDAQGTMTTVAVVAIVGRGRAISVLTMSAGDEVLREITKFLDSVKVSQGAAASSGSSSTGDVEVDFDVPPGYVSSHDGQTIVLRPAAISRTTACIYGISPSRPSGGALEADARAALLEPLPGWQIKSDHSNAMRGTAGAGWSYYWLRTDVQQMSGSTMQYLTAMAMAFPSGPGRVSIFWGFGATGPCTLDDHTFLRLFFSLRPRGVTPDGGKALGRELQGLWRDTQNAGMAQVRFLPDGRYEYGLGTSTTFGNLETRTGSAKDGRWDLRGSELNLTGGRAGKYRVRIYDELLGGVWRRAMSLLNESGNPALDVHYMRIER